MVLVLFPVTMLVSSLPLVTEWYRLASANSESYHPYRHEGAQVHSCLLGKSRPTQDRSHCIFQQRRPLIGASHAALVKTVS